MIKVFSMFSGYGGDLFALKKAKIKYESIGYSEIDKYAIDVWNQNHNKKNKIKNFGDCTKINPNDLEDFDLLTAGFPCQSFSVAGKGLGEQDTRGTLFYEIIKIAKIKQPKYLLLENVKGLISKKHKTTFNKILSELNRIGYNVYWQVLNSKDYNIPQNRERVWFVCFRKDLQINNFDFPSKEKANLFLKDILEDDFVTDRNTSYCLDANYFKGTNLKGYFKKKRRQLVFDVSQIRREGKPRIYENVCNTLNTAAGGGQTPLILLSDKPKFRKLTPKECFRLMGFLKDEIKTEGISNTQKYKLAGNGWDINIVSKIIKNLLKRGK